MYMCTARKDEKLKFLFGKKCNLILKSRSSKSIYDENDRQFEVFLISTYLPVYLSSMKPLS